MVLGGVLIYEYESTRSRTQADAIPDVQAVPKTKCPPRPWSVVVHAQGDDIGGTSTSTIGADAIVQTSGPVTKAQGVALASLTYEMLQKRQAKNRAIAYAKCVKFIQTCPGFRGKKTFDAIEGPSNRFDVDSYGPTDNFVS